MRTITAVYRDPIELIWVGAARRLGIGLRRSEAVYASWDGVDTLTISTPAGFDPDDNVGQMIFHELCHALVEGPERCRLEDYGLDNTSDQHRVNEDAAMRLQAALAGPHGLRGVLAVTTEWRSYYDALPADPLAEGEDPAIPGRDPAGGASGDGGGAGGGPPLRRVGRSLGSGRVKVG